jgi:hypothetical protein
MQVVMASTSFHVRKITPLPNGDYKVDVAIVSTAYVGAASPTGTKVGVYSVTLPHDTKDVHRLTNAAVMNERLGAWIAAHSEKWSKNQVSSYLLHILNG